MAGELAVLRCWPVMLTLAVAVLVNAGTFSVYTYLAQLVTGATGVRPALVPAALALFGVGSFFGVWLAARVADAHYQGLLVGGAAALMVGWVALALLARSGTAVVLVLITVTGLMAFAVGSGAIARSLALARRAQTLGGGVTTAALNVGATIGPVVGGAGLTGGPTGPVWSAAGLVVLAAVPGVLSLVVGRGHALERSD